MAYRFILLLVYVAVTIPCKAGPLDFSTGHYDSLEVSLLRQFVPMHVQESLDSLGFDPKCVDWNVVITRFLEEPGDTTGSEYLIFCVDRRRNGFLQLVGQSSGQWTRLAQTDSVFGEVHLGIGFADVDCDGKNEIVLTYASGADGYRGMDIVKYDQGALRPITISRNEERIMGRTVNLVKDSVDCNWEIRVTQDGPIKYEPNRTRTYRLDSSTKNFKFVDEKPLDASN